MFWASDFEVSCSFFDQSSRKLGSGLGRRASASRPAVHELGALADGVVHDPLTGQSADSIARVPGRESHCNWISTSQIRSWRLQRQAFRGVSLLCPLPRPRGSGKGRWLRAQFRSSRS